MEGLKEFLLQLVVNYPEAVKQIEPLENVTFAYYSLAFGVTPAIFVLYERDGDKLLERVRLTEKLAKCFCLPCVTARQGAHL